MILPRRTFLRLAACAAALPAASRDAPAQAYPSRPVRIVVGFAPGGATDIASRLIAQWLSERLGQQFIIENRPGAATNLATEAVVRAPADGYTLLAVTTTNLVNATLLLDKLNFTFNRDLEMVAGLIRTPLVLEVNPSLPVKTVPDFITYAKANPGKITMASFGTGSSSHVTGELFKMMTGIDLLHVPYRGSGPLLTDLLGGRVQMTFDTLLASLEHIRAGKLRALAVTTATRSEALPDIPTIADFVPGFEASAIVGLAAPMNTPAVLIERLNKEVNAGLADPKIRGRFAELSASALTGSTADFAKVVNDDIEKWGKVVKFANIKPE
jgi:tripartite-type tricarboxylate transporter receptor subunit TctC